MVVNDHLLTYEWSYIRSDDKCCNDDSWCKLIYSNTTYYNPRSYIDRGMSIVNISWILTIHCTRAGYLPVLTLCHTCPRVVVKFTSNISNIRFRRNFSYLSRFIRAEWVSFIPQKVSTVTIDSTCITIYTQRNGPRVISRSWHEFTLSIFRIHNTPVYVESSVSIKEITWSWTGDIDLCLVMAMRFNEHNTIAI